MHGLIFKTSIWLLAGSTRLLPRHHFGGERVSKSEFTHFSLLLNSRTVEFIGSLKKKVLQILREEKNTATSLTNLTRRIALQAQLVQLISFTIRHQLVSAISNASLRCLRAALDIRNYFACWLRQASQPDWPSTSEPSIIQTISEWYWYNNPLLTVDVFEASTANTTRLCRQIVVKSMFQRSMFFSAGIETDWPLKLLLDQSTYVRPDRVEQCSINEIMLT